MPSICFYLYLQMQACACLCVWLSAYFMIVTSTSYPSYYAAHTDNISRDNVSFCLCLHHVKHSGHSPFCSDRSWHATVTISCMIHGKRTKHPIEWTYSLITCWTLRLCVIGRCNQRNILYLDTVLRVKKVSWLIVTQTRCGRKWNGSNLMFNNIFNKCLHTTYCITYWTFEYISSVTHSETTAGTLL